MEVMAYTKTMRMEGSFKLHAKQPSLCARTIPMRDAKMSQTEVTLPCPVSSNALRSTGARGSYTTTKSIQTSSAEFRLTLGG